MEFCDGSSTSSTDEGIGLTLQDRIKAVSRKTFLKDFRFEADVMGGVTTNDAFSLDVGGAGNLFSESLESVRLLKQGNLLVPDESALLGYADGGITFAPVYGKVALMSELIIHFDAFVSGGVGAVFDTGASPAHPAMEVGVAPGRRRGRGRGSVRCARVGWPQREDEQGGDERADRPRPGRAPSGNEPHANPPGGGHLHRDHRDRASRH